MYYRGSRVPLSEKSPRFNSAGLTSVTRIRARKTADRKVSWSFLKRFKKKEKPVGEGEAKTYAFYRPGVTPVEGTPSFSKKNRSWVLPARRLKVLLG